MPYEKYIPFEAIAPAWPSHLFSSPPAGTLAIVGYEVVSSGEAVTAVVDLALADNLTLSIAGLDGFELVLPGDPTNPLRAEVSLSGAFAATLEGFDVTLRIRSDLLIPVEWRAPEWVPLTDQNGQPAPFEVVMNVGALVVDESFQPRFELDGSISLGAFMIGETGLVIEATGVRPVLSANEPPPPGQEPGFRGLSIESALVHLPDAFALPGISADSIAIAGLAIGNGGISGAITGNWSPVWVDNTPTGPGAGTFLGMPFGLRSIGIVLTQNAVTGAQIAGDLLIPFFDERVAVTVQLGVDGSFLVEVAAAEPGGAGPVRMHKDGIGTLELSSIALVRDADGDGVLLSGRLELEVGSPALQWPAIDIQDLRIAPGGAIKIPGGWIDLQEPIALDLYGFGMEISRIGFGNEDDGRRWIGVDGAVRLTELLPAGASARGLRVAWDPNAADANPTLSLDGIGVTFGVPDAFAFEGEVSLTEDSSGAKLFTGGLGLGLDALDIGIDAGITIGRLAPDTFVFVTLGVNVPIPIAASGTALYGMQGLFAMNMSPLVTNNSWPADSSSPTVQKGDWYGWYKLVPDVFEVSDPGKWSPDVGAWAFGAGLSLGTLPDAGFTVNTKALLVVLLPGPVILLEGKADLFKVPTALSGSTQEGTLSLLAAIDGRAGTLQLGIDAAWNLSRVIEIAASTEAFFDFDRSDAWHLWIGQDTPESARIRADYLALFHADAWMMLDAKGVDTGLGVSWGDSWKFGPARVTLEAWVGGRASLSARPSQLTGQLGLGGEASVSAGPFGVGINVEAGLSGKSFAPYEVAGTVSVAVELPKPLKDLDVDIELEWSQPATPTIEDPWVSVLVEHARCTESWAPVEVGSTEGAPSDDAPVVPLDAGILLTFAKPMGDDTNVANDPAPSPAAVTIGGCQATYELADLRLHRRRRSHPAGEWEDVSDTLFGSWTPDAGSAGSRLQLLTRSPFAFTRFTSRRWTDSFLSGAREWPCSPKPEALPICVNWHDEALDTSMPALWEQKGATFATEATLSVVSTEAAGNVLRLRLVEGDHSARRVLWIGLPEPVSTAGAVLRLGNPTPVILRGWSGDQAVATDVLAGMGFGEVHVVADGIDAVTLEWTLNTETDLYTVCWIPQHATDSVRAWTSGHDRLEAAADRWESAEPVLEPDCHYLLEVTTRALLHEKGKEISRIERTHVAQFQTGGPPGIVPAWVPGSATETFPRGGVLKDLADYVRWTIPDPGAAPVFRAYDLGCEFDASHVQQMYGADMRIRLRDDNGQPALDSAGEDVVFENAWEEAPTTTLTTSDAAWLARLDACTGAVDWAALRGNDSVSTAVPGLLYDDFSGAMLTSWRAVVLDREERRPAHWHLDAGVLRQTVDIAGGDHAPDSPDKPGTVYIATDVNTSDVALEVVASATSGAYGLIFRWKGPSDYYRFSLGPQRVRLVRVKNGMVRELWSLAEGYVSGAPTRVAVQVEGGRVRCQVDERLVCDVTVQDAGGTGSGGVGLYTWNTGTATFDDVRARSWPGGALSPEAVYTAELEASRPLFTDAFDNLDAFEPLALSTGDAATTVSAFGGVAIIARPPSNASSVAALAGDPDVADCTIECNACPRGEGPFGLVARHSSSQSYLSLELTPGVGRRLVAHTPGGIPGVGLVLWHDDGDVQVGRDYALSLRCEGEAVTFTVDSEVFTASTSLLTGRFGLLSGILIPDGCAFRDLVVRSAPRAAVHSWRFTTSRYRGLPDLLDAFVGHTWPVEEAVVDRSALASTASEAALGLSAAQSAVDAARAALAAAVAADDVLELPSLLENAQAAVGARHDTSAQFHDALAGAMGLAWRPTPPVLEVSTVADAGDVVALLLDLPEPLPWERIAVTLATANDSGAGPLTDLVLAWSDDGTRAILVRADGVAFAPGQWELGVALRLDAGAERAVWRRGGSSAPEVGRLLFAV